MIKKPELTDEQMQKFTSKFSLIISKAPVEVSKLWTGEIGWVAGLPHFENNVQTKLKGELAKEYRAIKKALDTRTI